MAAQPSPMPFRFRFSGQVPDPVRQAWQRLRSRMDLFLIGAVALFVGRASFPDGVDPLLIAYVAAARDQSGEGGLAAATGVLLGLVWSGRLQAVPVVAACAAAVLVGLGAVRDLAPGWRSVWGWGMVVGLSALAGWAAAPPLPGGLLAVGVADGLLGAVVFVIYRSALPVIALRPAPSGPVARGAGAVWILLGSAMAGAFPLSWQGVPAADLLVPVGALTAAQLSGAEGGAVVGVLLGALSVFTGTGSLAFALMAAAAGTLAGAARPLGRPASALAYLAASAAFAAFLPNPASLIGALVGLAAGVGLVLLLPEEALQRLAVWLRLRPPPAPEGSRRLKELAQLFGQLSAAAEGGDALGPNRPGVGFERRLVEGVTRRACRGCPWRSRCWDRSFSHTYAALTHGLARLGRPDQQEALERSLGEWCARPREVAIALGYVRDSFDLEAALTREWQDSRSLLSGQLRGLAEVLAQLDGEEPSPRETPWEEWARPQPYRLSWTAGLARRPGKGVSGDSAVVRELPGGRLLVALSDGMGVGEPARAESLPAVGLAERLLAAGFGQRVTAQTVNAILLLGGRGDAFATLDLAVVDLATGEAEFTKIGAVPTWLRRQGRVERLAGEAPPAGIVQRLEPHTRRRQLSAKDWLVFMTDGAYDALCSPDEAWLAGFLRALDRSRGPQWVADQLASRAAETARGGEDLTVVAVRLEDASLAPGNPTAVPAWPREEVGARV